MTVKEEFKTLFSGLKLGHPENVAVVHPLVFLLRRIFFAIGIVYLGHYGVFTLSVLQIFCLFSLGYSLEYRQWNSTMLNFQHLANEGLLYIILSLELCISAHEEMEFKGKLGESLIWLVVLVFAFNLIICLYSSLDHLRLLWKRAYKPKKLSKNRISSKETLLRSLTSLISRRK